MTRLELKLKQFDFSRFQNQAENLREKGLEVISLSECQDDERTRKKLYTLVKEGVLDDPGTDGKFESYEEFVDHLYRPYYWDVGDTQLIVRKGDSWLGLCSITFDKKTKDANAGLTIVKKEFRQQGIAKALKALSLKMAQEHGSEKIVTENHPDNLAMVRVNEFFGFEKIN